MLRLRIVGGHFCEQEMDSVSARQRDAAARDRTSVGMFDLFKGIGMILVLWHHSEWPEFTGWAVSPGASLWNFVVVTCLMPMFFIVSGYGFRPVPLKKAVRQQSGLILRPYCYTGIATVVACFVFGCLTLPGVRSVIDFCLSEVIGFLFATQSGMLFGLKTGNPGPCWYLAALFLDWCCLCLMYERKLKNWVIWVICAVMFLISSLIPENIPLCLESAFRMIVYLLIGYRMKKRGFLEELTGWKLAVFAAATAVGAFFTLRSGVIDGAVPQSAFGSLIALLVGFEVPAVSILLIRLILFFNRFQNPVTNAVSYIGQNSLLYFCVHTVEYLAFPWWKLIGRFGGNQIRCYVLMFLLRFVMTTLCVLAIRNREKILNALKSGIGK